MKHGIQKTRARRNDKERFFAFFSCLLFILLETLIYRRVWYTCYVGQPFLRVRYWNRGNWVYVGMFAVFIIVFGLIFKSFTISSSSRGELILSHIFMDAAVHAAAFIQLSFIVQKYWLRWHIENFSIRKDLLILLRSIVPH